MSFLGVKGTLTLTLTDGSVSHHEFSGSAKGVKSYADVPEYVGKLLKSAMELLVEGQNSVLKTKDKQIESLEKSCKELADELAKAEAKADKAITKAAPKPDPKPETDDKQKDPPKRRFFGSSTK